MTTYPKPADPVNALTRAGGTSEAHSTDHGRVIGIWENVKHHGAVGNGTTDDTAAFTDAIDAVASTGGTVFVPPGTYKITSSITTKSYLTIKGSGAGSKLLHFAGSNPLIDVPAFSTQTKLRDFQINGPGADDGVLGTGTGHGVYLHGVTAGGQYTTRNYIEHVRFNGIGDATHWCVYGIWAIETHIHHCDILAAAGGGIYLGDTCNASSLVNNTASNGGHGSIGAVFLDGPNGVRMTGNVWEAWRGTYALKILAGGNHYVDRDWFEDNSGTDIIIGDGTSANRPGTVSVRNVGALSCTVNVAAKVHFIDANFVTLTLASVNALNSDTSVKLTNSYATTTLSTAGLVNANDRVIYDNPNSNGVTPAGLKFYQGGDSTALPLDLTNSYLQLTERSSDPSTPSANVGLLYAKDSSSQTRHHTIYSDGTVWRIPVERSPAQLTDAATVATDCSRSNTFYHTCSTARTMGAPTNMVDGQRITYFINVSSGGPITPTWNAAFNVGGAFTIADGKRRTISFIYWALASAWIEVARTADT